MIAQCGHANEIICMVENNNIVTNTEISGLALHQNCTYYNNGTNFHNNETYNNNMTTNFTIYTEINDFNLTTSWHNIKCSEIPLAIDSSDICSTLNCYDMSLKISPENETEGGKFFVLQKYATHRLII